MKVPFERFVVHSISANEFMVRVSSPDAIRESLKNPGEWERQGTELSTGRTMMDRCVFIDEAIKEKLERVEGHRV